MANVYEIATKISMTNAVSPVLAVIAREVLSLEGGLKSLNATLGTTRGMLAMGGGLAMAGGFALAVGLKHAADHAKELSHELVQIQKLNISAGQMAQVRAEAIRVTQQVPGTNEVEALKTYGSTFSIFGHEGAVKLMKGLSEFAQAAGNTSGNYEKASHSLYEVIRAGDLMGKFVNETTHKVDPEKLQKFLDLVAKVTLGTHGKVDGQAWLGLAQQGGPALSQMSDKGLLTMAIASQAMGGPRAGTALTSLYQQVVGGRGSQQAATKMAEYGLMAAPTVGRGGHLLWDKGQLDSPFANALKSDPLDAVRMMKEALEKHGKTTLDQQVPELFQMLGRQTTQRLIHDLLRNFPQIMAERERIGGAMGVVDSNKVQNNQDYVQAEHNMAEAWKNLMFAVAGPNAENAIALMKALTDALNSMTDAVRGMNPDTLRAIGVGLAGLSAALIGGGAVALLAALGPAGWIAAGVISLGVALVAFPDMRNSFAEKLVRPITLVGDMFKDLWNSFDFKALTPELIEKQSGAVKDFALKLAELMSIAIRGIPGMVVAAIQSMAQGLAAAIGNALKGAIKGALSFGTPPHGVGDGGENMGVIPQSFKPAPPSSAPAIHNIMYLDGEVVHRSVVRREYHATEHSRQAPTFDGYRDFGGANGQLLGA